MKIVLKAQILKAAGNEIYTYFQNDPRFEISQNDEDFYTFQVISREGDGISLDYLAGELRFQGIFKFEGLLLEELSNLIQELVVEVNGGALNKLPELTNLMCELNRRMEHEN